jgi:hypothetical protein
MLQASARSTYIGSIGNENRVSRAATLHRPVYIALLDFVGKNAFAGDNHKFEICVVATLVNESVTNRVCVSVA